MQFIQQYHHSRSAKLADPNTLDPTDHSSKSPNYFKFISKIYLIRQTTQIQCIISNFRSNLMQIPKLMKTETEAI